MLDRCVVFQSIWEVVAHGIIFKIDAKVLIVALVDRTRFLNSKRALLNDLLLLLTFRLCLLLFVLLFLVFFLLFLFVTGGARAAAA